MAEPGDLEPVQWLNRLAARIMSPERQDSIRLWRRYYSGDHDLPTGPSQISDAYKAFQRKARTNLCGQAVRSMADRMRIIGYQEERGQNAAMWKLFTDARLTARQTSIWRKALSEGSAYVVVGADPRDTSRPRVTIEGADHVAVELDPADPMRRIAGARLWHDPLSKRWYGTVYLPGPRAGAPGRRYGFQSRTETPGQFMLTESGSDAKTAEKLVSSLRMDADSWEPRGPVEGEVSTSEIPIIPFFNADEGEEPLAEFAGEGIDIQDRLNLSVLNRLTTERFQAYRQRALLNFVPEEDPATGLPMPPFKPGADQVWTVAPAEPGDPEPRLIDLPPSDTANMLRACEADMRAFAAATTTPVYYLPGGDMINLAADAIMALDAGHNAKVTQRSGQWTWAMSEVWNAMAAVAGVTTPANPEYITWAPPQAFHPSAVADYVSKMVAAGTPLPMVLEEMGWSPARINQLRGEIVNAQMQAAAAAAIAGTGAPGAPGAAPARPGAPAPTGARTPPRQPERPGTGGPSPRGSR